MNTRVVLQSAFTICRFELRFRSIWRNAERVVELGVLDHGAEWYVWKKRFRIALTALDLGKEG